MTNGVTGIVLRIRRGIATIKSRPVLTGKSEGRNPRSERSPKSEARSQIRVLSFGFRISVFGFLSDFGIRISDFSSVDVLPRRLHCPFVIRHSSLVLIMSVGMFVCHGGPTDDTNGVSRSPETAREFYNAGTRKLRDGKLNDAESLLLSALAKQDEGVQPAALYNLGHIRFGQGLEELKKSPSAKAATARSAAVAELGAAAIHHAESALQENEIRKMVEAYMAGRGARKEIRAATDAVRRAMDAHGQTLAKWRRSLSDFKSAAELNPSDTNAVRNVEIVARAIARLVDSLREMQQMAMQLGGKQSRLNELLQQLKGRIPKEMMPPGAAGDEEEEEMEMESLRGLKEKETGGGQEMETMLSREEAGRFLDSLQPNGKLLPMQGDTGNPKDRPRKTW